MSVSPDLVDAITELQMSDSQLFNNPKVQSILKHMSFPVLRSPFQFSAPLELKDDGERIIAGYASVELVDKQGDIIPLDVLKKAWDKFISNPDFMTSQLLHSNVPIGKFILEHPKCPKKAGVDDKGLFVICKIRDDIKKADEAWDMIKDSQLRAFSIGGEALKRSFICEDRCYKRIDELELHEISIVGSPANQGSYFTVIKQLSKPLQLKDVTKALPEGMILVKDFICGVGSVAEKGSSNHDFDLLVKHPLDENSFLRRAVLVRLQKEFPELTVGRGGDIDVFFGDSAGPHDSYVPLYDLVLLKREQTGVVPMKIEKSPFCSCVMKSILKSLTNAHEDLSKSEQLQVQREILKLLNSSHEELKVWTDEAREAAAEARRSSRTVDSSKWSSKERKKIAESISFESMENPDSEAMQSFEGQDAEKISGKISEGKRLTSSELNAVNEFMDRVELSGEESSEDEKASKKVWSDEARAAAAEARRGGGGMGDKSVEELRDERSRLDHVIARTIRSPPTKPNLARRKELFDQRKVISDELTGRTK